jgi:3',5'-cyclic AMP phosphodiesterase CpdA
MLVVRRSLIALSVALLAIVPALAHDPDGHDHDHPPVKVPDATAHRPTAIPDRIILTWTGDPATTQAVTWRTDATVGKAVAQIAPADAGPLFVPQAKTVNATSEPMTTDLGAAKSHSVEFRGLSPKLAYAYRVGDGVNWSAWTHFKTASDRPEPFSFIYFGDAQNDIKSLWSRVIRGAYSDAPKARFIVHAGDLINHANADAEWGEWHAAGGWVNAMVPSVPTPGNHEYERPKADPDAKVATKAVLSRHWRPTFALPTHGPKGLEETAYFFDYQGVRIVSLNSNEAREAQVPWLREILARNPCRWTIVTFHHPIYSSARDRDNSELRNLWQPVLDECKVDLVLQGHDHTYARSGLRVYDNIATGAKAQDGGTVYVVSVSGPKMYNLQKEEWMKRAAEDTQLYQIIHIDGETLRYEARTAIGDLYDAFDLIKHPGRANQIVEKAPATPERRRPPAPARPKSEPKPAAVGTH